MAAAQILTAELLNAMRDNGARALSRFASQESSGVGDVQSSPTPGDNGRPGSGAGYLFTRSGTTWVASAFLKATTTGDYDAHGGSVAVGAAVACIGAIGEDSDETGLGGNGLNDNLGDSGAAYIYY